MGRSSLLILLLFVYTLGVAQSDSTNNLSYEQYMEWVLKHHPVAQQAELRLAYGEANLMKAKGAFDPKLAAGASQKYFDGKQYYSLGDGGVKIPTTFGVELKAGYKANDGVYLNNENKLPDDGLLYAGVSLPVGEGLFIDERRAELRKARLYNEGTVLQRRVMLNDLLLEAGMAYWKWSGAFQQVQIYQNALTAATARYDAVVRSVNIGERPSIDTVEASIQVQNRNLQLQTALLKFQNASAGLSVYLWQEGTVPMVLSDGVLPDQLSPDGAIPVNSDYRLRMDTLVRMHPELSLYENKLQQLEVQKKWNKEQLKPTLNLRYNPIAARMGDIPGQQFSTDNYTWGFEFSTSVFLRKERASLRKTQMKIQETEWGQQNKQAHLIYKANAALNDWQTSFDQVELYRRTVRDSRRLLEGERQLFTGGESSLFMVNSREQSFIKAQQKQVELEVKNRIAEIKTKYVFGLLAQ